MIPMRRFSILLVCLCCVLLLSARERVRAVGPLFAAVLGSGTACTQSAPCTLTTAISVALSGRTIYIGAGTFLGTGDNVILIDKNLTLRGGWDGAALGGPVLDPANYVTRITGSGARRVILIQGSSITVDLAGLTVDRGAPSAVGGGLYVNQATEVTVENCIFTENAADGQYGGAIYAYGVGTMSIGNSTFTDNTATYGGGAIEMNSVADAVISGSRFTGNASSYGSVVELQDSVLDFFYNEALDNTNSNLLLSDADSRIIMISSLVAPASGGTAVDVRGGFFTADNNTFIGASGGTAFSLLNTTSGIVDNIFSNWAESMYLFNGAATIDHNMFFNNTNDAYPGTNVVPGDPCFIDPASDNYRLGACSAAVDAGANTGIIMDLDGNTRPIGGGYDLGAYERLFFLFLPQAQKS